MSIRGFVDMLDLSNFVVMDTETTGLGNFDQIVSIAIADHRGQALLVKYVKPTIAIPAGATAIHGITDDAVRTCKEWNVVRQEVLPLIKDKDVVVYNAKYDRHMMHTSDEAHGIKFNYHADTRWWCAMTIFAEIHGEIHPYYNSYVWKPLDFAALRYNVENPAPHTAWGDAITTLRLCWKIRDEFRANEKNAFDLEANAKP